MKILFTSVGRRVELVQAFRDAARRMRYDLTIYGADLTDSAPALAFCDVPRQVCRISDAAYVPQLLELCDKERIDLLIPTIDTDLLLLAKSKHQFEEIGTRVLVSTYEKVKVCRDKRYTSAFFTQCGLKSPIPVDGVERYGGGFPCFIKPKDGSSSIHAYRVDTEEELRTYARQVPDYIIQPFIEGREYTIDIMCDFYGEPIFITPRERLAVRSGEVLKTQICLDEKIIEECKLLIAEYKPCGPITVQMIRQNGTGDDYFIEINPRFGGGAPLSMKAGADAAESILRLLQGEDGKHQSKEIEDGAIYSRFDQSIQVNTCFEPLIKISHVLEAEYHCRDLEAVVFDLDDTLYSEKDYVRSGYRQVAEYLKQIDHCEEKLWDAFKAKKCAIDFVLQEANLYTAEYKEHCLQIYRNQKPDICLYDGVSQMLERLRKKGLKLGIITDGRVEGQKAKIKELGLEGQVDEIIITDELAGKTGDVHMFRKPNQLAYQIMADRLQVPYRKMAYVGDNSKKDFKAPGILGMRKIFVANPDGLYVEV